MAISMPSFLSWSLHLPWSHRKTICFSSLPFITTAADGPKNIDTTLMGQIFRIVFRFARQVCLQTIVTLVWNINERLISITSVDYNYNLLFPRLLSPVETAFKDAKLSFKDIYIYIYIYIYAVILLIVQLTSQPFRSMWKWPEKSQMWL